MQRIINQPNKVVEEMLEGFVKCHGDILQKTDNPRVIRAKLDKTGRVGIVTGGGSGHKPAFIGYIGKNMVDAAAVGEIFSSPTAKAFHDAFREADQGVGVACLYGNYAGDNMNVKMAIALAADEGIQVKTVVANDDVPSAPLSERQRRRGVAGEIFMWKAGGARAALGGSLDEVIASAKKAIDSTRSIGVGLTSCTIPEVGHPNFTIEPGKMELGIGHHGEPGIAVTDLKSAKEIAILMLQTIFNDQPFENGEEAAVLISGLGATPVSELYILYNEVEKILCARGVAVYRSYVGNYFTSLDMMGATLSVMKLDEELKTLLDMPVKCMGLKQF